MSSTSKFIDPNIARKNKFQNAHLTAVGPLPDGSPVFSEVEFNITGLCNRTCVFCPRVDPKVFPNTNEHLSLVLYEKILRDLQDMEYKGRISYSGFGEPFLHRSLISLVEITRAMLEDCWLEIVTNGDNLSDRKIRTIFDAGLSTLLISMYDGSEQISYFEAMIKKSGVARELVILRKRYLAPEEGYGINLTNRAGTITLKHAGVTVPLEPLKHPCYYTHYRMMVDYTGEVLLCPHDWGKRLIVGNLKDDHIRDLWTGPVLTAIRKRLGSGDRNFAPCNTCDVMGTRQGGEHFQKWQEFYGEEPAIL